MRCRVLFPVILLLVSAVAAPAARGEGGTPVLAYHRFDPTTPGPTTITTPVFERQLDWLDAHDIKVMPLRSVVDAVRGGQWPTGTAGPAAAITVDDGHVSVYTQLYPIIRRRHVPVTLFIYPSAISNAAYALTWEQLAEMVRSGLVDVQSHTYWHPNFRKERARRTPDDYRIFVNSQLVRSKAALEQHLGIKVDLLAWPFGIIDADLQAAAQRAGYRAAFAYEGGWAAPGGPLYAIPRIPVSNHDRDAAFAALLTPAPAKKGQPR
ncbi:peptidoglycan/xylan/chitin deacetylase (PgdA/CDA1 family) [Nitrospirillum amazonense]|uniref:Chitooligosaccharide deacetylase n=1 Tax=Nitrospirillum amazonense TaxID=28077 RepID=A0A560J527_9PROT|nr:polysaccharide deacetylase family protein [Nitrospirillum amazonense]TWB65935.1 peptidoglycan/xylan/chitin deacetylase (PgdA/CDA1 family) [Nitrospirillum amazonense]